MLASQYTGVKGFFVNNLGEILSMAALELTSKRWKLVQLVGFFVCIAAVVWFMSGEPAAILVLLLGLLVFCIGRIGAWWSHG